METEQKFIIFDCEVSTHDWLIVFKKTTEPNYTSIHNDKTKLIEYVRENIDYIFVGFNNNTYDNWIISAILSNRDPYEVSTNIINRGRKGWELHLRSLSMATIDLKQEESNMGLSLKEAECNLGLSIEEMEIDWDLGREWTKSEYTNLLKYCKHDVFATEQLFFKRKQSGWIDGKLNLVKMLDIPMMNLKKTSAYLTSVALGAKILRKYNDEHIYTTPDTLKLGKYKKISNLFQTPIAPNLNFVFKVNELDCTFGLGGVHGAKNKYYGENLLHIDVSSYYPNLMIEYGYISRSGSTEEHYRKLLKDRLIAKQNGEIGKSTAYKLILNTTYGAMDNEYNNLFDPRMRRHVSISGQLFLVDLIDKIDDCITELVQVNTDGLIVKVKDEKLLYERIKEWETRTRFSLSYDKIDKMYQKDVNNYWFQSNNGHIKVKGAYLKQSDKDWNMYSRNTHRIVDLMLNEYFKDNSIDIMKTLKSHKNILDFQILVKSTSKFDGLVEVVHNKENKLNIKVARVFATTKKSCGEVYKLKKGVRHKIGNLPLKCFIWNKDINELKKEDIELDYNFYYEMIISRINDFTCDE